MQAMRLGKLAALTAAAGVWAAPALSQEPGSVWRLWTDTEQMALTYGVPGDDAPSHRLTCLAGRPARIEAIMWAERRQGGPTVMVITSGEVSGQVRAFGEPRYGFREDGGTFVHATFATGGPVMAEFARTGRIQFTALGTTTTFDAAPVRDAEQFVRICLAGGIRHEPVL